MNRQRGSIANCRDWATRRSAESQTSQSSSNIPRPRSRRHLDPQPAGSGDRADVSRQLDGRRPAGPAEVEGHRRERVDDVEQHDRVGLAAVGEAQPSLEQPAPARLAEHPAHTGRIQPQVEPLQERNCREELGWRDALCEGSPRAPAGQAARRSSGRRRAGRPGRRTSPGRSPWARRPGSAPRRGSRRCHRCGPAGSTRWPPRASPPTGSAH